MDESAPEAVRAAAELRVRENSIMAPGLWDRIWRRRVGGILMVSAVYGPYLTAKFPELDWHWFGSVTFHYGELLSLLPGTVLTALLAPRVAYRRRDALTLLFPPRGIRVAWIIGTRMGQLPHRRPDRRRRQQLPALASAAILQCEAGPRSVRLT